MSYCQPITDATIIIIIVIYLTSVKIQMIKTNYKSYNLQLGLFTPAVRTKRCGGIAYWA